MVNDKEFLQFQEGFISHTLKNILNSNVGKAKRLLIQR